MIVKFLKIPDFLIFDTIMHKDFLNIKVFEVKTF